MLTFRKLTTPPRALFWIAAMSLAMAYPSLAVMAQTFSSSNGDSRTSNATSRSVSFSENGKTVSISEDSRSGITVTVTETVDGQPKKTVTKAANAAELAKKNPAAYDLYRQHLGGKGAKASALASSHASGEANSSGSSVKSASSRAAASGSKNGKTVKGKTSASTATSGGGTAGKGGTPEAPSNDAKEMLRRQLREMRKKNADNPAIVKVIDDALRQVDEDK